MHVHIYGTTPIVRESYTKAQLLLKLNYYFEHPRRTKLLSLDPRAGFLKPEALSVVQVRAARCRMSYAARTCLYFAAAWAGAI